MKLKEQAKQAFASGMSRGEVIGEDASVTFKELKGKWWMWKAKMKNWLRRILS